MTDKFMSGWGPARNKTNKLVITCDSYDDALIVADNASRRPEMKYINITSNKPRYNSERYHVSSHGKPDYERWFIPNQFG